MMREHQDIENIVKDAYVVQVEKAEGTAEGSALSAIETQQRLEALVKMAEELQQQYGAANFSYRRFEFTPAIAAVIRGEAKQEIIVILQKEGYVVKEQGRMSGMSSQNSLSQDTKALSPKP